MLKRELVALVFVAIASVSVSLGVKAQTEDQVHNYCDDYEEALVGLFVGKACTSQEAWWPIFQPWASSLEEEEIDDSISSIFVNEGWSISVSENPDGSGRTSCVTETKWDLSIDSWPDGQGGSMNDAISYFEVFEDDACGQGTEVPVEHRYCDELTFEGVGFYDLAACEWPGESLVITTTGTITLGVLTGHASSVYIAPGWSILASNGEEEVCLWGSSKWDLSQDKWPSGQSQDNSILVGKIFDNELCNEPPSAVERLFLPSLSH